MTKKLLLFAVGVVLALTANAYDFKVDGLYYNRNTDGKSVTVTSGLRSGALTIPSSVSYNGTTYSVTNIGDEAFNGCSGLTSVTIPNSVTSIGNYAFYYCTKLAKVQWNAKACSDFETSEHRDEDDWYWYSESVNALFYGCTGLTTFEFGSEVERIPAYLCYGLTGLTSVTIPNSVTSIGNCAFYNCSGLTSITIPNSVTSIGDAAFSGTAWYNNQPNGLVYAGLVAYKYKGTMPSGTNISLIAGTKEIAGSAFRGCSGLTSITIPNSVTTIGDYAFYDCTGLTSVTIGNSVISIGESAFGLCRGLTSVTIPNSVTDIGGSAFYGCSGLTSVTIPNSVITIGNEAFYGCRGLTSVTIPNSVTSIGRDAFYKCTGLTSVVWNAKNCRVFSSSDNAPFTDLTNIKTFEFGSEVERIPAYLCYGLTGLTSVTIPNSVTSIGDCAFYNCSGLTSITIPNSVTYIGGNAFSGTAWYDNQPDGLLYAGLVAYKYKGTMPNGTAISLKAGTKGIAGSAFSGCSGLTSVTIPNSVTYIGSNAFSGTAWYNNQPNGLVYAGLVAYKYKGTMPNGTAISLKAGTKGIAGEAFSGCSGLTSVTIPNSVTSIGDGAFSWFSGLTRIEAYPNPTKVTMGSNVFYDVPKAGTLHVLPKYLSAYQTASQWKDFYNIKADLNEPAVVEDVDGNGTIDVSDINAVVNAVLQGQTDCDITGDGIVDVSDVNRVITAALRQN